MENPKKDSAASGDIVATEISGRASVTDEEFLAQTTAPDASGKVEPYKRKPSKWKMIKGIIRSTGQFTQGAADMVPILTQNMNKLVETLDKGKEQASLILGPPKTDGNAATINDVLDSLLRFFQDAQGRVDEIGQLTRLFRANWPVLMADVRLALYLMLATGVICGISWINSDSVVTRVCTALLLVILLAILSKICEICRF